eukprot:COSAG01_NODE_48647_length_379_cov_0.846429_1_plen_50_part_10
MLAAVLLLAVSTPPAVQRQQQQHGVCTFHNHSQLLDPGSRHTLPPRTAHS